MEGEKEKINSSPQKDMPISRNSSSYAAGGNSHNNIITSSSAASQLLYNIGPTQYSSLQLEDQRPYKKVVVRYKECLKNHAAAIGGNATDGCGEFMPSGEQGSLEALKCSACNCHRNFHRKEIEGESSSSFDLFHSPPGSRFILDHHHNGILESPQGLYPITAMLSSRPLPNHQMIVSYNNISGSVPSESDEKDLYDDDDDGNGDGAVVAVARQVDHQKLKKRFRTKFTEEQKQKMLDFAEKAGWKMQKLEDSLVQRFCQEIGIKRRVLKVWMHNNKHHFSKKPSSAG